jgi:hypothetical protein
MIERICKQCGKEFWVKPSKFNRKFCSRDCYAIYKSNIMIGKSRQPMSDITKQKLRESHIGLKLSEESKRKMSITRTGKQLSESHKINISNAKKGDKNPMYGIRLYGELNPMYGIKGEINPNYGSKRSIESCKKMSESHKGLQTGKNNPAWKGGISFEPYCPKFNKDLRNRVRLFWENKCGNPECNKSQDELNEKLSVHHVHYDKLVCCNDKPVMLIPLCRNCHGKTNHDRERYERIYEKLIYNKYNGRSYFTKDEYKEIYKNK